MHEASVLVYEFLLLFGRFPNFEKDDECAGPVGQTNTERGDIHELVDAYDD